MIEHFQQSGEVGVLIEKEVEGVERAGVCGGRDLDTAIRTGEARCLQ